MLSKYNTIDGSTHASGEVKSQFDMRSRNPDFICTDTNGETWVVRKTRNGTKKN